MVTFQLDCQYMTDREQLHHYLKETLSLPEYYGNNLDALFDCLTELGPTTIQFSNLDRLIPLGDYGEGLLSTFRDAALENPNLDILF